MTNKAAAGGEPGAARLLDLARRELLEHLLPQLQGESRYRARLIANAMKIAAAEGQAGPALDGDILASLQGVAERLEAGAGAQSADQLLAVLAGALRSGRLDADPVFFEALDRLNVRRRSVTG